MYGQANGRVPIPLVPHAAPRAGQRVTIVQHPRAGPKTMSQGTVLDIAGNKQVIHYDAPTQPGSSGAPVFDDDFNLVALHRAGRPGFPSIVEDKKDVQNEATSVAHIVRNIEERRCAQ